MFQARYAVFAALVLLTGICCLDNVCPLAGAKDEQASLIDQWHAPHLKNAPGLPELNVKVVNFAVDHLGKKVGNGECWTLAAQALESSGAQPPRDYVFGRELRRDEMWLPGDVVQFTSCKFVEVRPHWRSEYELGWPNHTAIVYSYSNGSLTVLEQNINNDRRVQTQVLNLPTLVSGRIQAFRPFPASFGQSDAEQFHEQMDPKEEKHHKRHHRHDDESVQDERN